VALTGLLVSGAFGLALLLALTRHPIFGLIAYISVFYLHPPSRWWGASIPLRWSLMAAAVTVIAILIHQKKLKSMPLFRHKVAIGFIVFLGWLLVQQSWALDKELHMELIVLIAKFGLALVLVYKCIDTEQHLRWFLWTHVLGCVYLGYLAYTMYDGGRFEGFGGPGINEANAAALQLVTGALMAGPLFFASQWRERAILLAGVPLILNALVTTISRSGFLEIGTGMLVFNYFAPKRFRWAILALSGLALVVFFALTNDMYWNRIDSISQGGAEVQGVDTGSGRLDLAKAQMQMFARYPMGCGHRCTAVLSPEYLPDDQLVAGGGTRARSSHNTVMSLLVEQGVPGGVMYALLLMWMFFTIRGLAKAHRGNKGLLPALVPGIAAVMAAITVGDLFVDYIKFEARIWFIALAMVMVKMTLAQKAAAAAPAAEPAPGARARAPQQQPGFAVKRGTPGH
jgi:hypothetical protein